MNDKKICVGIITKPHGIQGWVRIRTFTVSPDSFLRFGIFFLDSGEELSLKNPRICGNGELVSPIDGCNTRNDAEAYRARKLFIRRTDLPELLDGEYYIEDLVGLDVKDLTGNFIGKTTAFFDYGAGLFFDIRLASGKIGTIAFNGDSISDVDVIDGMITVDERLVIR
ncbi:MAG: ribosome maturation factor RimM [Holosporales bacterium]|jgi:16S rRNA processing protein RimM|nr:ribosome maturation factor RimM [Holosporales bacterium]